MRAHRAQFAVTMMSAVLEVFPSGFYAWLSRKPSKRSVDDAKLLERIVVSHAVSDGTYGAPRVLRDLREEGFRVGEKRVARLMKSARLQGVSKRAFTTTTTRGDEVATVDLVQRDFTADAPNRLWVADITYIPTWEGFLYLAIVLDVFSRRIVGWSMQTHLRTELVLEALEMALEQRKPDEVIHHSDHGCQYTSIAFGSRCDGAGVRPSLGSVGDAYDNAMCESFFSTLECELLRRRVLRTKAQARNEVFRYIEGWYNPQRRHSALQYLSPMKYEHKRQSEFQPQPVH